MSQLSSYIITRIRPVLAVTPQDLVVTMPDGTVVTVDEWGMLDPLPTARWTAFTPLSPDGRINSQHDRRPL